MKLLDLFCGAGGASRGYINAGFEVMGLDVLRQRYYPLDSMGYVLGDFRCFKPEWIRERFDAVHASPPCQAHTRLRNASKKQYKDLIPPTRELLQATGLPYVIENVPGAPLVDPIVLCGDMFGLKVKRHRLFESNVYMTPPICLCVRGDVRDGQKLGFIEATDSQYRDAMECDWMSVEDSRQAIPPRYTEWIGYKLIDHINAGVVEGR